MADPRLPYLWAGKIFQSDGTTPLADKALTLTNEASGEQLTATSASDGSYVFDLAGLTTLYVNGDKINVVASGSGTKGKVLKFKAFAKNTARLTEGLTIQYTTTIT